MDTSKSTWILALVVAAMGIVTVGMLALLAIFFYLSPEEAAYIAPMPAEANGEEPIGEDAITSERVQAIAEKMEGVDGVHEGAKFGLYVEGAGYTVGKTPEGILVVEGGQEYTDLDLYLDSMETFEAVENADDVCAKIRELRNAGNITYEMHISEMQMFFKGYLSLAECLE